MKKETTKKSKLWIIILAALLLIGAVVGGIFAFGGFGGGNEGGEEPGTVVTGPRADLYWNLDREFYTKDSQTGLSTREADANGQFKIRFAYNGEIVELVIVDKKLVNIIDTQDVMGLKIDENGVVIGQINVRELATETGKKIYVKKAAADVIQANSSMAMNGMELNLKVGQYTEIYDLRPDSETLGKKLAPTDLLVMDCITVYSNADGDVTHIFLHSNAERSKIYWRANLWVSSSINRAGLDPDENGVWTLPYYCDGELVNVRTKDIEIVDYYAEQGVHSGFTGLKFDDDGYAIDIMNAAIGIAGQQTFYGMDVIEINGNYVKLKNYWTTSGVQAWEGEIPADVPIYNVSSWAYSEGVMGQTLHVTDLQVGDRITMFSDMDGNPVEIGLTLRRIDLKPMFNNSAKYDSATRSTTRVKDEEGYWTYTFIDEKGIHKYKTKDQKLANFIDSYPERVFGIVTKGDKILKAYEYNCLFGYTRFSTALYVDSINGTIVSASDNKKANAYTAVLSEDYKVLDISGDSKQWGQKIQLQLGDCMISFRNTNKEVCLIYVTKRSMGGKLYVNTTPDTSRTLTEEKDADGKVTKAYWTYEMTDMNGKKVTLTLNAGKKDKDGVYANKYLQSRIDSASKGIIALEVSGTTIKDAHTPGNMASGNSVNPVFITKAGTTEFEYKTAAKPNDVASIYPGWTGNDGMKMINLTADVKSHYGEKLSGGMKVNDVYYMVRNRANETVAMFLISRGLHNDLFFVKDNYGVVNGVTTRPVDAEGYYVFNVMYAGKPAKVRTKDVNIATSLESKRSGAALKLDKTDKKNIVLAVTDYTGTGDAYTQLVSNWDVSKISGKNVTVKINIPTTSTEVGETKEFNLGSAKVYNISPNAGDDFGKITKLQKNDRVRVYTDKSGNVSYVLVTVRNGVKTEMCEHCGKKVTWNPLTATSGMGTGSAHYYVYDNVDVYGQWSVAGDNTDKYDVVIDLNGKTVFNKSNTTRTIMAAYPGKTLTLMDSVGTGKIQSYGYDGNAGLIQVTYGATLNILGGTYELLPTLEGMKTTRQGGVIFAYNDTSASGRPDYRTTLNIKGGTFIGGDVQHPTRLTTDPLMEKNFSFGGTIYAQYTDVTISGGTIKGGLADRGGNIYIGNKGTLTVTGGEIVGGQARNRGGNIFGATGSVITIDGGKVIDGKVLADYVIEYEENGEAKTKYTGQQGGNIVGYKINFHSGEISGGTARTTGGNIFALGNITEKQTVNGEEVTVIVDANAFVMTGGKLANGTAPSGGGNYYVYGNEGVALISGGEIDDSGFVVANDTKLGAVLKVTGGKIGSATITAKCGIIVGGDAQIDYLSMNAEALPMGIEELSETAKIVVKATGKFAKATVGFETLDISAYAGKQIISSDSKLGVISCETIDNVQWLVSGTKNMHEIYMQAPEKAIKMTTDGVFNAGGEVTAFCPACDMEVKWTPLTATMKGLGEDGYDHYYLADNVTRTDNNRYQIPADKTICIHLNGFTYDQAATSAVEGAIKVAAKGTLNIMGNGTVIGAGSYVSAVSSYTGGAIDVRGTVNILGGTYKSSHNRPAVACFAANNATLNMYAGKLEAGVAVTENPGTYCGTFMMYNKTQVFNMYGGEVVGGDAGAYGNLKIVGGTANFFGGAVSGRVVTGGTGTINIHNGAKIGAGNGGLVIKPGVTVNLADDLAAGTEVYISEPTEDEVALTVANAKAGAYVEAGYIKSTNSARPAMVNAENQIFIASSQTAMNTLSATLAASTTEVEALCPLCGVKANWVPLTAAATTLEDGGHYYLAESLATSGNRLSTVSSSNSVSCVHLNGKTYDMAVNSNAIGAIRVNAGTTVNILDCAENTGVVIGPGYQHNVGTTDKPNYWYAGGAIDARGTVNIYGGTFMTNRADRPAVACFGTAEPNAVINMYGGKIVRNEAVVTTNDSALSSLVRMHDNKQTFNMYGGSIEGGKAENGGNVRLQGGTFNLIGGTITGGTSKNLGGNICVRGGIFTMTGGTVTGGTTAASGGNFGLVSGTLDIQGGTVSNGTAVTGGMVYVYGGTLKVTGGEIKENIDNSGGAIQIAGGTSTITGGTYTGNIKQTVVEGVVTGTTARDITVGGGKALTVGKTLTAKIFANGTVTAQNGTVATVELAANGRIAFAADVAEGTKVTVIAAATQTIATIENAADFLTYFESGVTGATIGVKADTTNEIEIVIPVAE